MDMCYTPEEMRCSLGVQVSWSIGASTTKSLSTKGKGGGGGGGRSTLASLTLKVNSRYQVQVVQVYAPTSSHDDEEVDESHEEITEVITRTSLVTLM